MGVNEIDASDVSADALAAEVQAIDVPGDPLSSDAPEAAEGEARELSPAEAESIAAGYRPAAVMLVTQAAAIIAPAWDITREECEQLGGALALALAHWFPDAQLPPKYAALLGLGMTAWSIAEARRDPATGRLRPMRERSRTSAAGAVESEARSVASGGGFSTAA